MTYLAGCSPLEVLTKSRFCQKMITGIAEEIIAHPKVRMHTLFQ